MEFSNFKKNDLNETTKIMRKFTANKENMSSGISLTSFRSKKAAVNVKKSLEDFNSKFDFKFSTDELNQIKTGDIGSKNDILKCMIAYKF